MGSVEIPVGFVVARQLQVFEIGAQHLDRHGILVQNGIVKLALGHLL